MNKYEKEIVAILAGEPREKLYERLRALKLLFHNLRHAEEVRDMSQELYDHMLPHVNLDPLLREIAINDAALRHDDGYRVGTIGKGGLSNEERAVELMRRDLEGLVPERVIRFERELILSTMLERCRSRIRGGFRTEFDDVYRDTLCLADVGYFSRGWSHYLDTSLNYISETGDTSISDPDSFIESNEQFLRSVVFPALRRMKPVLETEYYDSLMKSFDEVSACLRGTQKCCPDRDNLSERLHEIRSDLSEQTEDKAQSVGPRYVFSRVGR